MIKHLIIALRIFVVALDVNLFYLFFWLIDKSGDPLIVYKWWVLPTFLLATLLMVCITIIAFHEDLEGLLCKK